MISKVTFTPATTGASAVTLHDPATSTTRFLSKIDGVVGPPAPRDVTRARPGVDGIVDQTAYLGERNITLEGELWGATGGASMNDLSTISEAFYSSLLSPGRLEWTLENGDVRWCNVKLAGGIETSIEGASRLVSYQVQLRASDPRVYKGPYATAKNSVSLPLTPVTGPTSAIYYTLGPTAATNLVNAGTAPSPPVLTIKSPTSNAIVDLLRVTVTPPSSYSSIAQGGSSLVFEWDTAATNTIVSGASTATIDSATRTFTVTAGTWDVSPGASSEFPMLYPGTSTAVWTFVGLSSTVTGAECKFEWFDAYW